MLFCCVTEGALKMNMLSTQPLKRFKRMLGVLGER